MVATMRQAFITDADRRRIVDAIRAAEVKTSGELVTVITGASDEYVHVPLLWAALIAMLVPPMVYALQVTNPYVYEIQLAVFVVLALVLRVAPIKMLLVPDALKRARAHRLAVEQFHRQGLHRTREGTGVLLFVSVAEHYVEIIADAGINARVAPAEWDAIVAAFVHEVRAKRIAEGFVAAIAACGEKLAHHFPRSSHDVNELPDRLIEL
jgi:putative membrane protein